MDNKKNFCNWIVGNDPSDPFPGCDGGDMGSPASPAIWVFGIEPGESEKDHQEAKEGVVRLYNENYPVEEQLNIPLNKQVFKLLAAINGEDSRSYREFSLNVRPFEKGRKGYFKGNLYPLGFHNVESWNDDAQKETGFPTKKDYYGWLMENRLPVVSSWISRFKPKLLIGMGISCLDDFRIVSKSFIISEYNFSVNGHIKRVLYSTDGIVKLVIVPHPTGGPNGLNSYESMEKTALFIRNNFNCL